MNQIHVAFSESNQILNTQMSEDNARLCLTQFPIFIIVKHSENLKYNSNATIDSDSTIILELQEP